MYFNGKTYFNQEQGMRVVGDQRNPPPRRKGVKKKVVKKKGKGEKVDMKKLKSIFGSDIIVKLLFSLIDKKAQGPNMNKTERGKGKEAKKMRIRKAGAGGFQTSKQVKLDREKESKRLRLEEAGKKKKGETDEEVSTRLLREVAIGSDPAALAYLQANSIPPALKRNIGNLTVLSEAYFSKDITLSEKKKLEAQILKQVISGVGGQVRTEFLTATEDSEVVAGITESLKALKESGFNNVESIIANPDRVSQKLQEKIDKSESSQEIEKLESALDGIDSVLELKTLDTDKIEATITDQQTESLASKKGAKKKSREKKITDSIDFMEKLNPALQTNEEAREEFISEISKLIDSNKGKQAIESKIKKYNKNFLAGNPLLGVEKKPTAGDKPTRADANIFTQGQVLNQPDTYDITKPDGTSERFSLYERNALARYNRDQLKLYEDGEDSDIEGDKDRKRMEKELEDSRILFRKQLKEINTGGKYSPPPEYFTRPVEPTTTEGISDLRDELLSEGFGFPKNITMGSGDKVVGIGAGGITIENNGLYRYELYSQKEQKKILAKQKKEAEKELKAIKKAGGGDATGSGTSVETLISGLAENIQEGYNQGLLNPRQIDLLPPLLQQLYPAQKKEKDKQRKKDKKPGQLITQKEADKTGGFKVRNIDVEQRDANKLFKADGSVISDSELQNDPSLLFDALDFNTGEPKTKTEATGIGKRQKYLDEYTDEEIAEIQAQPPRYGVDVYGNSVLENPLSSIPTRPLGKEQLKSVKEDKKQKQEDLIEEYIQGNRGPEVRKKLTLASLKVLTRKGEYVFTPVELNEMSDKESAKYEKIQKGLIAQRESQIQNTGEGEISLEQFRLKKEEEGLKGFFLESAVEAEEFKRNKKKKSETTITETIVDIEKEPETEQLPKTKKKTKDAEKLLLGAGNNKPNKLGEAIFASLGLGESEKEKDRKKKAYEQLARQQEELEKEIEAERLNKILQSSGDIAEEDEYYGGGGASGGEEEDYLLEE